MINVSLLLFNMAPAFPMDGGRVLRALLAMKLPYGRATAIASVVGRLLAIAFGVFGLMSRQYRLALVAVFVFFGAGAENQDVAQRESLRGVTVGEVVDNQAPVFPASLPAHTAFERLVRSPYASVAVVDEAGAVSRRRDPAWDAGAVAVGEARARSTSSSSRARRCRSSATARWLRPATAWQKHRPPWRRSTAATRSKGCWTSRPSAG